MIEVKCALCGKKLIRKNSSVKKSKTGKFYCNKLCSAKDRDWIKIGQATGKKKLRNLICPICSKHFSTTNYTQITCSRHCDQERKYLININLWKQGKKKGYHGKLYHIANWLRRYILEKFEYKCSECGWSKRSPFTGNYTLRVDHIDGDASNDKEENLRLLCPNCDSLTEHYCALNIGSVRTERSKYLGRKMH